MKGQRILFNNFASKEKPTTTGQRPRNFFMPERNVLLVHRFYYWSEIKKLRYEKCLQEVEQDLFLSSVRIIAVLNDNYDLLANVMELRPTIKQLSKQFPRMIWQ
jgi:hypothetical protein